MTSGMAVNELNRHTLPDLEHIDRIEVHYYPEADFRKPVVLNLVEPEVIDKLVLLMNDNKSWWKNHLQIVPVTPNYFYSPQFRYLSFFSREHLVRKVRVNRRILFTTPEAQEIMREVSSADSEEIYRLIASTGNSH